jgi:hypothetical protein
MTGLAIMPKIGLDGMLARFPAYIDDLGRFQTQVYSLVQQPGLR